MNDQVEKPSNSAEDGAPPAGQGLVAQSMVMVRAFMASPERTKLFLLGGALVAVIGATAFGQVQLNAWNRPFYDALERKDVAAFLDQLVVFAVIASGLLTLNVSQRWLELRTKVKLREGLVRDLLNEWLQPGRAFRLASAGEIGLNPDQRMHEDARHLTELSTELGIGLLQSSLLLGSFIGVLWFLSASVTFHMDGESFAIPGYLVWSALVYAGTASWLSWRVGRPLIQLQSERYSREARLRFGLVRVSEHIDGIALHGGEADERQRLDAELDRVIRIMRRIVKATTGLTWVTAGYGWFTIIAPILVAAPGYFGGDLTFGEMMMAVGAFIQVQQALRWFIDNFSNIADWRATLLRVASFRQAVLSIDELGTAASRIELTEATDGKFRIDDLEIASPTGSTTLSEPHVEIAQGDRVLILGEPGTGKSVLFRALAGLWPWGSGRVALPPRQGVMFVPRSPYVPPGSLRAALAYPLPETTYKDSELVAALECCGLKQLSSSLDREARWDRELSDDDQHCLVFARLPLHKPRWVVIDQALDAVDEHVRERILAVFKNLLADTAVVDIGRRRASDHFFTRVVHLIKDPKSHVLRPLRVVTRDGVGTSPRRPDNPPQERGIDAERRSAQNLPYPAVAYPVWRVGQGNPCGKARPPASPPPQRFPDPCPVAPIKKTHHGANRPPFECVALLLQGGGALGAYQAGVYQALAEADLHPDWVAGISIGAINAAIIAGNAPDARVDKLRAFWESVTDHPSNDWARFAADHLARGEAARSYLNQLSAAAAVVGGAAGFYAPRWPPAWLYPAGSLEATSYYETNLLKATLERFVDFDRINKDGTRLSVGAVNVRSGNFVYFDTTTHHIRPEHVMASGALPPGFPAVEVDGEHYWDGGLISNTPLHWVVQSEPRMDTLAFQVDLWSARGDFPSDLLEVAMRQKEIQYSSRTRANTDSFKRLQKTRCALARLLEQLPDELKKSEEARHLQSMADHKVFNIVHLIYRTKHYEGQSKDYEFSRLSMEEHWQAGYLDAVRTLRHPEVLQRPDNQEGVFTFDLARDGRE